MTYKGHQIDIATQEFVDDAELTNTIPVLGLYSLRFRCVIDGLQCGLPHKDHYLAVKAAKEIIDKQISQRKNDDCRWLSVSAAVID